MTIRDFARLGRSLGLAALAALPLPSLADGGVWVEIGSADEGHSADQRAVLVYDRAAATETLILSTQYRGAAADFAWVIPVPALPARDQVGTYAGGEALFEELSRQTAPRATEERYEGGSGCAGCVPMGGSANDALGGGGIDVTVVERLSIDGLDIALLDAGAGADLARWLSDNGYRFPAEGAAMAEFYVAKGWKFVAVKVDAAPPAGRAEEQAGYFPQSPLRLTFRSDQPVFPMRVSSVSTGPEGARVLLYVLDDQRVGVTSYRTVTAVAPMGVGAASAFAAAYEEAFDALLNQPGGRPFVAEYAGPAWSSVLEPLREAGVVDGDRAYRITRLRTHLRPQEMADDVLLAPAAEDTPFAIHVRISDARPVPGTLLPMAALTACFGIRRRRGLPAGRAAKEALLLGLLLLGVCFSA